MNKLFITISLIVLAILSSCSSEHKEEHHHLDSIFQVTKPLRQDTSIIQEYVCQIHSISHIEIRSQERGFLQTFYVDEGQSVKKGQMLFEIMPSLYKAEYSKAQAEANLAKIEYLNTKALSDSNIVSINELAMARANYDKAIAELEVANVHLGFTKIKAPFNGIIDRFHVRLGSLVDEGEFITTLSDNSEMWVYFNVPEVEYLDYMSEKHDSEKTKVNLKMANNKLFGYTGIVETIEADFNNETGNIPFRATFPNPEKLLRHGETGSIQMITNIKGALLIPQKATYEVLDKKFVFVIDKENKVRSREISIQEELQHLFIIKSGLQEDDKILLEGIRKVREGDEIKYDLKDPSEVISNLSLYSE
ncbi:MAG: membrane fusion protein (multidrug efflux system) [Vicingaceae bacterium]|jgi:membrane fusion protein (multidrug efflux system)